MTGFFEKIVELSGNVEFYTVRLGDNSLTEFELFDAKDFPDHEKEIELVYNVIDIMRTRGAKIQYFKFEGPAHALPIVDKTIILSNERDLGIRLYCIRLTDYLVVLLNGDIKTKLNPLECNNVARHFKNAISIAKKLDKLLLQNDINFQDPDCLLDLEIDI